MAISRSENMRRIRSKNTSPELAVRRLLRDLGYKGYRLHRRDLPGNPDVAFISKRKAIFIHGCFWHGHDCKTGRRKPKTNTDYWVPKILRNKERDFEHLADLAKSGWEALIVWECEIKDSKSLSEKLLQFLRSI